MIALEKLKKYTDKNRIFDFRKQKMQRNGKWLLMLKSKS